MSVILYDVNLRSAHLPKIFSLEMIVVVISRYNIST